MRKIYFLLLTVLFAATSKSQTTLISPTGDGGFETGATFAANGWTVVNGATNQWFVGSVAVASAGTNSAYVSDNITGTTYNYLITAASTVHFYRDVTFPAGETNIVLSFKWKCQGEGSYDYVTVYSMSTGITPTFNNPVGAFQSWLNIPVSYAGAVVHATPPNLNVQSAYQTQTICLPAAYAGTTRRLVFMWSNDPSVGTQPPGSIDEISLVTSLPPAAPANQPTGLVLTPLQTAINGSFTAAVGGAAGYLVVRYPAGSSPTNPVNGTTYAAGNSLGLGKVVSSGTSTSFSATGITGTYDFYVYSFNFDCTTGALYKTATPLTGTQSTLLTGAFSGAYTINPDIPVSATNFINWTDAVTALNTLGVTGPTTFTVTGTAATITFAEGNLLLGGAYISGVPQSALLTTLSATNTLTFVAGTGKTINMSGIGVSTTIDYVFRLQGVDYVTFDGINIVDPVTNITNTTQFEFGYVIGNAANSDGATNNTIRNFSITLFKTNTGQTNGPYGVMVQNGTVLVAALGVAGTNASRNNNNKIQNFTINGVKRGVSFSGLAIPAFDEGNEVSGPAFTSAAGGIWVGGSRITNGAGATSGTDWGIGVDGQRNMKVFNVQVDNFIETTAGTALSGIHFGTAASTATGSDNVEIYNCVVHNLENNLSTASGVIGIRASGTTLHKLKIYNNAIYDLRAIVATGANVIVGAQLTATGAGSKFELYNNSVNLPGALAAAGISKGFGFGLAGAVITAKNNAINFGTTGGGSTGGVIALDFGATTPTLLDFSNNIYNVGTTSAARRVAVYTSLNRSALIDWQSTLVTPSDGVDQRSGYGDPGFVSGTDLTYGAANSVENSGVSVSGLSTAADILGVARSVSTPDIGVFEGNFSSGFVDVEAPGISITPLEGPVSAEIRVIMTDNVNTTGNITTRLWYRLGVAGAFTALAPDVAPVNNNNGEYRWGTSLRALAAGTYQYYIVTRDAAGNYFADPTMTPGAVSPGFASAPDPNWAGVNPFASAGVRSFQNAGAVLAGGTYNVGATETYLTLTAVAAELSTKPISGNVVFELTNNYTGAGETFPIVFNQPSYTVAGPLTITIRPAASVVTERVTAGDGGSSTALILLDGMRDLTLDGRPGGIGSSRMWRITNTRDIATATIGEAIRLQNDALRNSFRYLTVQANTNAGQLGVFGIGSTFYGGKGNSLNTIDNCDIGAYAAGVLATPPNPVRGIAATGGGTNSYNNNNTYSNNNIHDFYSPTANPIGIFCAGETGITITGNSIYQTAPRTGLGAFSLGIAVNGATGPGLSITNNFIGGSAPLCAGGPMTLTSNVGALAVFYAMQTNTGQFTSASTISGNTMTNWSLISGNTTAGLIVGCGINPATGNNQFPLTISNNIIGSTTVDANTSPAITLTSTSTALPSNFAGVFGSVTGGVVTTTNNQIGGVKLLTTGTGTSALIGIQQQTAGVVANIDNNLIGSLATANNIVQNTNATVTGIANTSTLTLSNGSISNNTIANITYNATVAGTSQTFTGISGAGTAPLTINNNTIRDVVGNNHASLTGLSMTSSGIGTIIRGNTIRNFTINPQTASTAITVQGISTSSSTSTGVIEKNLINNLINGSTSTSAALYGTNNQFGANWTYSNNMISLGTGSSGDIIIRGIYDFSTPATTGGINYYYNTVSITGAAAGGINNTYAYYNTDGPGVGLKSFRNNIFSNTRTSGTGLGYAVAHPSTTITAANISSNYNDLYSATTVAQWQGTAVGNNYTFAGWQAATSGDANSKSALPVFISATDLHLSTAAGDNWCMNGTGIVIPTITTDIDGQVRSVGVAPNGPDIGADEFVATPTVDIATPASQTICSGTAITTIVLSGGASSYSWIRDNTVAVTGIAASGTGNISGTLTNTTAAPVTVTFTITPLDASGCPTSLSTFTATVTVNPTPDAVATPSSQTICSGATITTIALTGAVSGTTFNWTRDNTVSVTGIAASGSGNISGALTNTTSAPVTVTFTITPTANGCPGLPITATVLVNPTPNAVATPASQTICSGATITTIALTGAVSGTTFNWTRDNTVSVTGIAASGSGDISGALTNTTSAPVTVTFTITPTANSCPGSSITATVLVNPTPNAVATPSSQTICSGASITTIALTGAVSGTTFNWTRDNTVSVTGIAASGSGNISGTLTNTTNAPVTVTFTITPTANSCPGSAITATVLVNPTPNAVATPSSQTICSGATITTIALTGAVSGTTFNWTRDNTVAVTGIAASGSGDISGALTNTTSAPITVTFTITPTANGCPGSSITATVLVNPTPNAVATPSSQTICSGATITTIVLSGAVSGTTFNWTRDNTVTVTGIAASGSGNISGSLTNTTAAPVTVTFTITPTANGCPGTPITATVTVNPLPILSGVVTQPTTCVSADGAIDLTVSGTPGPYTYFWTTIGGSGIVQGVQDQFTLTVGQYTVLVTDQTTGCQQTAVFNLTGPGGCAICPTIGSVTTSPTPAACAGATVTLTASGLTSMGITYGITFKYSLVALPDPYTGGTVIGTVANGSLTGGGTIATLNTSFAVSGNYIIYAILSPTPIDPLCRPSASVSLTVNPIPDAVATPSSQTICSANSITTIVLSGSVPGTTFNWTRDNTVAVTGIAASGSGNISGSLTNTTNAPVTVTFTITPTAAGCTGTPITATVLVNPTPNAVATPSSQTICSASSITTIVLSGAVSGTTFNWTRDNTVAVTGIAASGSGNISGSLTNTTNAPVTVTFTITPTANGCPGASITATVLVNPTPDAVATPSSQTICSGSAITTIVLSGAVSGTTFNWTRDNTVAVTGIAASGSGNISGSLTNTTNAPVTVTFTITPTANGCPGASITATVLVNPTPNAVATPASQTICSGATITTIVLSGAVAGTTYNWTRDNTVPVTGIAASGSGNISGSLTNTTNAPVTVTFTITPTANGCPGAAITATVLVNPTPNAVAAPSSQAVCSGVPITMIVLSGAVAGTTFNWTRDNLVAATGIAASGSGNISGTLTNTTAAPVTVTFTITPTANGCPGAVITATVTVNPTPSVNPVPNQTVCNGAPTAPVTFSGPVAGTVYNWTNNTPSIGLAASGIGNIASFNAINLSNVPVTATITVTPVTSNTVTQTFNYTGAFQTFVVPAGVTSVSIQASGAQGNANAAGVSFGGLGGLASGNLIVTPGETLFVYVGGGGTTSINGGFNGGGNAGTTGTCLTAPGGGGGGASDLRQGANTLAARRIVGGGGGGTAGNRVVGCARGAGGGGGGGYYGGGGGCGYPGTLGTVPTGGTQAAGGAGGITGTTFGATNGLPGALGIGGAGGNEIFSNQAGSQAIIFGSGTGGGLTGGPGQQSGLNNFTGQSGAGGSSYIGGVTSGSTTAGVRSGNGLVTISYAVAGPICTGSSTSFTITVNPTPNAVATPPTQTICSGTAMTPIVLSGNVSGTVFNWTRDNQVNITGIPNAGSGNISGTPINNTTVQQTVTFTITPVANGCTGPSITATLIVNKEPTITCPANITVNNTPGQCGANVTYPPATATGSPVPVITYSQASGTFFPVGTTIVTATATNICGVATCTFTITVLDVQAPTITCPANIVRNTDVGVCTATIAVPNPTTGDNCAVTQLTWVMTGATTGSSPAIGINFVGTQTFNLNGTTGQGITTIVYTVRDAAGNTTTCSFTVTVNDAWIPVIGGQPSNQTVCVGTNAVFTVTAAVPAGNPLTYQWQAWNGSAWVNIAGANASTLTLTAVTFSMNTNSYRCILTGRCSVVTSGFATLYVNQLPTISLVTSRSPVLLPGQSVTITTIVNPPGGSYQWFKNGVAIAGATGSSLVGLTVDDIGSYTCRYTDLNGCVATSAAMAVSGQVSDGLFIYPNPNTGHFHIRLYNQPNEEITVRIFDMKGAQVYLQKAITAATPYTDIQVELMSDRITAGEVYIVEVRGTGGRLIGAKKIIVHIPN